MTSVPKLELKNIYKHFQDVGVRTVEALRDINLAVTGGEFVSIVGASGCGKTTLLRMVDGLESPSSGSILLDGQPVGKANTDRAFVFQADSLLPWRTILENVAIGLELQGMEARERRRMAAEYIALVGLRGFEGHYPHQISGGMRQRANLARALVVNPELLLMDEPFASLDAQTREIMQSELLRIWSASKKTVVFVTHQIDEAVYLSDRIVVLCARPGSIKEEVLIDMPRPRPLATKRTAEFVQYTDRVWSLIESDVRESISLELSPDSA